MSVIYLKLFFLILTANFVFSDKSFVLVIDTTGSMKDELTILKNHIGSVVNAIPFAAEINSYILVPFTDPDVGDPLISSTPQGLIDLVNEIEVKIGTGKDCPENSLGAVEKALEASKDNSYIFLFTDAQANDINKLRSIQALCHQRKSQVVTFLSGECLNEAGNNINAYNEMSKSCYGAVFNIDINSFQRLKPFKCMHEMVNSHWTNINTHQEFSGIKEFKFNVDTYTKGIALAVSGDYPEVRITNAVGDISAVDTIMDTRHSLVIRLLQVELGDYVAEIRSRGMTFVTFYKRKELEFKYGFSPEKARNLKETTDRPLPDMINYIVVELLDSNIDVFLLELRTSNDRTTLDLAVLDEDKGLYIAQSEFDANMQFRISVHAREINTNEVITGISNTIIPQKADAVTSDTFPPTAEIIEPMSPLVDFTSSLTLFCKVKGLPVPDIWWEDDNGNVIDSKATLLEIPSVHVSYATINNATTNTTVHCKVKNSRGNDSFAMEVFVHRDFIFDVLKYPSDTSFEYGTEGRLFCEVTAYPEATIKWYHNDSAVEGSENVEIVPDENLLLIKNMSLDDTGEYKCEVANEVEIRSFVAIVDITGLVAPSVEVTKLEYILKPGEFVKIECNIVNGNPTPKVVWKKVVNENEFDDIPDGVYVEGTSLKIPSVKSEHSGRYKCEATNIQGEDSKEIVLKVYYAPKLKNGDEIKTVKQGEAVKLECDVDAMPKAVIHWTLYQDDVIITFDDRHQTDDQYTHRFYAISQDSGNYNCVAENDIGRVERTVTVNVLVEPYIEPLEFKALSVQIGGSLLLTCRVSLGNPVPTTRWEFISPKFPVIIISRQRTTKLDLVLQNITKKDEGTYQCIE